MFTYTGVPAGPVNPGSSFTIGINLVFVSGGGIPMCRVTRCGWRSGVPRADSRSRLPIWTTPAACSSTRARRFLNFCRCWTQSTDILASPPNQDNTDLGALALAPLPSGTYFLANLTFAVAANALPGNYTIGNTTSIVPNVGGRISVINDNNGNTSHIAASNFDITVVPEPSSFALMVVGALGAGLAVYGRRIRQR